MSTPKADNTLPTDALSNIETTPDNVVVSAIKNPPPLRPLADISADILRYCKKGLEAAHKIGKWLIEAKAQLPENGKWKDYLETLPFHERQAQRFMELATGYPDTTILSDLGQCKARALLKVNKDEREAFIKEPHMTRDRKGAFISTSVNDMSVRQLEYAIRKHNGPSKKKDSESASQANPNTPHNDEIQASEPTSAHDSRFEYCESFKTRLSDSIDQLSDSSDERNELTDKLRDLRDWIDETLKKISKTRSEETMYSNEKQSA